MSKSKSVNPVSPKVSVPFILGIVALAAETATTLTWDETNWIGSAIIVLYALSGYLVNDPDRNTA